jgi:hypothetical protein
VLDLGFFDESQVSYFYSLLMDLCMIPTFKFYCVFFVSRLLLFLLLEQELPTFFQVLDDSLLLLWLGHTIDAKYFLGL